MWSRVCAGRGWLGPGGWALSTWVVPALGPLSTTPIATADVWEAPDTAQAHGIAHARQDKLDPVRQLPCWRLWSFSVALLGTAPFCADRRKATISEASA